MDRYPDGEPGERDHFISWQVPLLCANPQLAVQGVEKDYLGFPRVYLGPNYDPDTFDLGDIGYERENLKSWETFKRVKEEKGLKGKFQVRLPIQLVRSFLIFSTGLLPHTYSNCFPPMCRRSTRDRGGLYVHPRRCSGCWSLTPLDRRCKNTGERTWRHL